MVKPKDLKPPFTWETRHPVVADGVFHVPQYYFEHVPSLFPGWESREVFGNSRAVHVEYCAGNGTWLAERARCFPEINWVGVEIQFERVRKIWSKRKNENLNNLFAVCGDAYTFTRHYLLAESIDALYINFPDPWPKEKHQKHRLMKAPFIQEMGRVIKKEGTLTFVTDALPYLEETLGLLLAEPIFESIDPTPHYVTELSHYGSSFFDSLWREEGRAIHYARFRRIK